LPICGAEKTYAKISGRCGAMDQVHLCVTSKAASSLEASNTGTAGQPDARVYDL
jgi:hypothetical protein